MLFRGLSILLLCCAKISVNAQCGITVDFTVTQPCNNDGQIATAVTGGTAPYTYAWHKGYGSDVISTDANLSQISGGNYSLQITDATGCVQYSQQTINVSFPFTYTATISPYHCPTHDGSIVLDNLSGGAIPYTFLWSNGEVTQSITNLTGGNYDVTVTHANGGAVIGSQIASPDTGMVAFVVPSVNDILVSVTSAASSCSINSASASATVTSGGTAPFSYVWGQGYMGAPNTAWNTASISNIAANNTYTVSVTDANGCIATDYAYIQFNPTITLSITGTQENCNHHDGTATAVANGGTVPYTYAWGNAGITQEITGLAGRNSYYVTVTDAAGCQNTTSYYVLRYSPINANLTDVNEQCSGSNGSASVAPTGGTAPYTFVWSNGATTTSIIGLAASYYYVTVTDNNGCSVSTGAFVQNTSPINSHATYTNQVCSGALGSATLAPTGGTVPYTFAWSNGATTASLSNLTSGSYAYTITDNTGCTYNSTITINLTIPFTASASKTDETCLEHNGSATANVSGTSSPFSFLWSTGASTQTISGLSQGYYSVTITDNSGCSVVKDAYILRASPLSAALSITQASCIFTPDGSAAVSVSGGTAPYTYLWGNGSTTATASGLHGDWGVGVVVTDANGCIAYPYSPSVGYLTTDNCATIISGTVVDDVNGNCTQDAGETGLWNTLVTTAPGGQIFTNSTGQYRFVLPSGGNYALSQFAQNRNQICPTSSLLLNNTVVGTAYSDNNFYDQAPLVSDLRVSLSAEKPRPGFNHTIYLVIYNDGLYAQSGSVELVYDAGVSYEAQVWNEGLSVTNNVSIHTLTLSFSNLAPSGGNIGIGLEFSTPASTALGTQQNYSAHVTPDVNDATPPNNTEAMQLTVVGSYDPNEISVVPVGRLVDSACWIASDTFLKYTIRFQNTGNFPATFVAIRDTVDETTLDLASFKAGAGSGDYRVQLMDNNTLVFLFDPINLPDSATDEPNSHGFVSYYIKRKPNLTAGTLIENSAAIYFDFNVPVFTNTLYNIICQTSGIDELTNEASISIQPNPFTNETVIKVNGLSNETLQLSVFDIQGRRLFNDQSSNGSFSVERKNMSAGIYIYEVRQKGALIGTGKMIAE